MLTRSNRLNVAQELRLSHDTGAGNGDPETLDNIELRYQRQHSSQLFGALSLYYQQLDAIGWNSREDRHLSVGEQQQAGLELELSYRGDRLQLDLSHQYTKLIDFELSTPTSSTQVTAQPYGFGNDLSDWSNHISKLTSSYVITDAWRAHGNLQILWGYPGTEDYVEFRNSTRAADAQLTDPGWDDGYGASAFLNLGIEFQPDQNITFNLVGHNLLGHIDEDLNKQNYIGGWGGYRISAPSIGLAVRWTF